MDIWKELDRAGYCSVTMRRRGSTWAALAALATLTLACGSLPSTEDGEDTELQREALNACNETVPEERIVDGIPAYAQCEGVESGDIWSNNGVDTSATSGGEGWFRTQRGGGYQCTELARRYLHFVWDIDYQHGNAQEWCDGELPPTLALSSTPVHGDLIVFEGGVCGAAQSTGHIALIDEVDASRARVTFIEQNRAGRRSSDIDCAKCFLHVVANDGTPGAGGSAGAGGEGTGASSGAAGEGGGAAGVAGGEPGATGGAGGTSVEPPPGGSAGASNGGAAGSMAPSGGTGAGGAGSGAAGGLGGTSASSGAAGLGGGGGGQPGVAGQAGAAPSSAGGAGAESPVDAPPEEDAGMSCSATVARGGSRAPIWFGVLVAGLALRLRRRAAAGATRRRA